MLITIPLLFISLIISYFFFRHFKIFTLFFFLIVPLLLTPLWISYGYFGWFRWFKIYSLIAGVFAIFLTRFPYFSKSKHMFNLIYVIVGLNILEAVIKEALILNLPSALNILMGILIIFSLIDPQHNMHISLSKERDFIAPKLTWQWITAYSIWHWSFIYYIFSEFALRHLAVLGAPFFIDFIVKGTWLQARAITLSFYVLFSFTAPPYIGSYFPIIEYNQTLALVIVVFNLIFWICYRHFQTSKHSSNQNSP